MGKKNHLSPVKQKTNKFVYAFNKRCLLQCGFKLPNKTKRSYRKTPEYIFNLQDVGAVVYWS